MLGAGISVPNLACKWGQSISMGEVLYSTKWVKYSALPYREPQYKTQQQHTTYNMSRRCPTLQWLLPSFSMETSTMDPNLGTAHPYGPYKVRGIGCFLVAVCSFFGAPKCNTLNIRERDVTSALGGYLLVGQHNNQPKVSVSGRRDIGEGARPGRNMWGECCTIV
jgi:hypothetical protein